MADDMHGGIVKIFISWSGDSSRELALKLKSWLVTIIQQLDPFVSAQDIAKGELWGPAVGGKLEEISEGIICVTRDNQNAPWLNFEAGALAKATSEASVRPVLLDVATSEVTGPLASFQHTDLSDKDDVLQLVKSINNRCASPLGDNLLEHTFLREWPDLHTFLVELRKKSSGSAVKPRRTTEDLLTEILGRVRSIERDNDSRTVFDSTLYSILNDIQMQSGSAAAIEAQDTAKARARRRAQEQLATRNLRIGSLAEHPKYGLGQIVAITAYNGRQDFGAVVAFQNQKRVVPIEMLFVPDIVSDDTSLQSISEGTVIASWNDPDASSSDFDVKAKEWKLKKTTGRQDAD